MMAVLNAEKKIRQIYVQIVDRMKKENLLQFKYSYKIRADKLLLMSLIKNCLEFLNSVKKGRFQRQRSSLLKELLMNKKISPI